MNRAAMHRIQHIGLRQAKSGVLSPLKNGVVFMRTYILRRLGISVPILLGLTLVTFIFTELMPGDFVDALIPPTAVVAYTPEQLEAMREAYGLNKPPHE